MRHMVGTVRMMATASLFAFRFVFACGGEEVISRSGGSGGSGGSYNEPDGATCVDIRFTAEDRSCNRNSDCVEIFGVMPCSFDNSTLCDGFYAMCPGGAVNQSAATTYAATISGLTAGDMYDCPAEGNPSCQDHVCCLTGFQGDMGCSDAGLGDAGLGDEDADNDTGKAGGDAGQCVAIDLADYSQECERASDCVVIKSGEVCSGSCNCGDSPISQSGLSAYEKAIAGINLLPCPCAAEMPVCTAGICALP